MSADLLYQSLLLHFGCSSSIRRLRHHLLLIGRICILTTTWLLSTDLMMLLISTRLLLVEHRWVLHVTSFRLRIGIELLLWLLSTWAGWRIAWCTVLFVTDHILLTRNIFSHGWVLRVRVRWGALGSTSNHLLHSSVLHVRCLYLAWHLGTRWCFSDAFLSTSIARVGGILSL